MKFLKTSYLLACLFAVCNLNAQFENGDWLLEGGVTAHLEGSFGKTDIDLSQNGFAYFDTDRFDWNVSAGRFFGANKEFGLLYEETWQRRVGEFYQITPSQDVVQVTKTYNYDFFAGIYFRRYYNFGKGWYGGFQVKGTGGRGYYAYYRKQGGADVLVEGYYNYHLGVSGNLFLSKMIVKHFGGRVSFGNIDYTLSTKGYAEGVVYSSFDINLRNLITPDISIFWTFHGKSKKDRD